MDVIVKSRLNWVTLFLENNDAGYTCRRCGISCPTLRKWVNRYKQSGIEGLQDHSKRPHSSPNIKITRHFEQLILSMRKERNLGARRLQTELHRLHEIRLSITTIHKVLTTNAVKNIVKLKRKKKYKRYQRLIPGDRVQILIPAKLRPEFINIQLLMTALDSGSWIFLKDEVRLIRYYF